MANRTFIRFANVTIANAATISECVVGLTASNSDSDVTVTLTLGFADADDQAAPTDATELDALTMTTATVAWSPGAWTDGEKYFTPDLKTSLQEVVDRGGWASGQAVVLIIEDNGSSGQAFRRFSAYDFDSGSEKPFMAVAYSA